MYYVWICFTLQIVEMHHQKIRWQFHVWQTLVSSLDLELFFPGKAILVLPVLLKLKYTISRVIETLLICFLFLLLNCTGFSCVRTQIYIIICDNKLGSIAIFSSISFAFYKVAVSIGQMSGSVQILRLLTHHSRLAWGDSPHNQQL